MTHLFDPLSIGPLTLANRIVVSPMCQYAVEDGNPDDWLLYVMDSPSAGGGRGLSRGSVFSRDGRLVASMAQEGMVRVKA